MGVVDYSKRQFKQCKVPHLKSTDLNRIQVTTHTCCDISWLCQIAVMCHIACWFRSGAVLTFDQFYQSSFF